MMKTQYGLLDELVSSEVLDTKQVSLIQEKDSYIDQTRQLLEEIARKTMSDETKKHVSNLIRGKGERAAEYGDHWPLLHCTGRTEYGRMTANRSKLIKLIDSRNGLLDEMLSADCINDQHMQSVKRGRTDESRNTTLYTIVLWGSLVTYHAFIRCLLQTKQHQVVHLLETSLVADIRPLSDDQQSRLKRNYSTLVHLINSKDGLIGELYAADCITSLQKEYIESASRQSKSNERLIKIVVRGSETDYHKLIKCLYNTGQRHVSRILMDDGAVAHIVANIRPDREERRVVDQLTVLLRDTPDEQIEGLVDEARQRINRLRENEASMLIADIGHSIGLFYFTTSLRGLQYLREMYSSEQLKSMMRELFILLLKTDDAVVDLYVDTLRWDLSNYTDCLQQLFALNNLQILSDVYEMSKQNQQLVAVCDDVRSLPIDQFPYELFEMILVRTTGHLFVTLNRKTPRAEVYALATIITVNRC